MVKGNTVGSEGHGRVSAGGKIPGEILGRLEVGAGGTRRNARLAPVGRQILADAQGQPYPTEAEQVETHLIATGLKAVYTQAQVLRGPNTPAAAVAQWAQSEAGRTLLTWGWCGAGVGHALSPQGQHVWAMVHSVYDKDPDGKAFAGPGRLPPGLLR